MSYITNTLIFLKFSWKSLLLFNEIRKIDKLKAIRTKEIIINKILLFS